MIETCLLIGDAYQLREAYILYGNGIISLK